MSFDPLLDRSQTRLLNRTIRLRHVSVVGKKYECEQIQELVAKINSVVIAQSGTISCKHGTKFCGYAAHSQSAVDCRRNRYLLPWKALNKAFSWNFEIERADLTDTLKLIGFSGVEKCTSRCIRYMRFPRCKTLTLP